jgi:vancomycin resistance protein VanJ
MNRNARARIDQLLFWGYLIFLVLVGAAIYLAGDRIWWGTLLLFGPRWIWGIPIPVMLLLHWRKSKARRWILIGSAVLFAYFIMGFNLPVARFTTAQLPATRFMTLNLEGDQVDWQKLQRLLDQYQPDVLLFQECPANIASHLSADWNTNQIGQLAIATRYPLAPDFVVNWPLDHRWPRAIGMVNRIQLPSGSIPVATVHLTSPRNGLDQILNRKTILKLQHRTLIDQEIQWRRQEAEHVLRSLSDLAGDFVLGGDFNMPVESTIYRQNWGKFKNAFSWSGFGFGATAFQEKNGLSNSARIDHLLYTDGWQSRHCWVGPDVGSDHRPVFADLIRDR